MSRSVSSSLTSGVFIPSRLPRWPKIDDDEPYAMLHKKFWGKAMADEERQWLNAQGFIPDSRGQSRDEGPGENDSVDKDDGVDDEDNILPGCYVLDIGIRGVKYDKI